MIFWSVSLNLRARKENDKYHEPPRKTSVSGRSHFTNHSPGPTARHLYNGLGVGCLKRLVLSMNHRLYI